MFIPLHDANKLRHIDLQYMTLIIIAANCLVFFGIGALSLNDESVARAAYFAYGYVPAVANGRLVLPPELETLPAWTDYFSYAFLHGDFMHLAGNMLFLWVFGDNVEDAMGHWRFVAFFLLCAAAGALAHNLAQPDSESPLVGASGAAAGVIAAYLMLHPHVKVWVLAFGRIPLRISAYWALGGWVLFQVFSFLTDTEGQVSWAAHLGGILAGAVLLPVLKRANVSLFDRETEFATSPAPQAGPSASVTAAESAKTSKAPCQPQIWGRRN